MTEVVILTENVTMTDRACTAPRNTVGKREDSQCPIHNGQNHPISLHNILHFKVYTRSKERYIMRQQSKKREQQSANKRKYGHILYRMGNLESWSWPS
eukprot:1059014-Heterocapsa_arctica.AAC.1